MGKTVYLECNAGVSGDMMVAALLDLGADEQVLMDVLHSIPVKGFQACVGRVKKAGVDCCDFLVKLDSQHENHDHDMDYLHGDSHHQHNHESHHHHTHEHRGLTEIMTILNQTDMTVSARSLAMKIFDILAEAEAKAHAVSKEEVHFHEVGAIDSIVDIVAVAVCVDNLELEEVIVPRLCEGTGTVRCQHGVLSVPVPAVANILRDYQLPIEIMDIQGEFVTPTGAAVVAALKTGDVLPDTFTIEKIGMGAGKRSYERPSILRAMIIKKNETGNIDNRKGVNACKNGNLSGVTVEQMQDMIYKLETNIDDCTGENLGYVMELLFEAGARDVHYMPVYMKKNRPGWQLNVICKIEDVHRLEQIIFRETTTIGIRRQQMERSVLKRNVVDMDTSFGTVKVKECELEGEKRYYPEYESVSKICRERNLPYGLVWQEVLAQIHL